MGKPADEIEPAGFPVVRCWYSKAQNEVHQRNLPLGRRGEKSWFLTDKGMVPATETSRGPLLDSSTRQNYPDARFVGTGVFHHIGMTEKG